MAHLPRWTPLDSRVLRWDVADALNNDLEGVTLVIPIVESNYG